MTRGLTVNGPSTAHSRVVTTTGRTRSRSFVGHLPGKCSAFVNTSNNGLSRNRGRLLYVAELVLISPPVLVLSRTASDVSAQARVGVRHTFRRLVRNGATFVITRELSAVGGTSLVLIVGGNSIVRGNARRSLVTSGNFCCGLCGDRFDNVITRWLRGWKRYG